MDVSNFPNWDALLQMDVSNFPNWEARPNKDFISTPPLPQATHFPASPHQPAAQALPKALG